MNGLVKLGLIGSSLVGIGLLALAGCVSTVLPESTRYSDSGITSVIHAALEGNDKLTAQHVEVETREGVVYLTGTVETEGSRREAGRVAWSAEGVDGVMNDIRTGK